MTVRRLLIHLVGGVVGATLALILALFLHTRGLSELDVAIVVTITVFGFQVLAAAVFERLKSQPAPSSRESSIRGNEPWGWLRPANGKGAGFPLNKECVRIGRGVDMDILINNGSISRQHARVRRLIEGCLVADCGSRNGIYVNGERVKEQTLNDGDQIRIGELQFVFVKVSGISIHGFPHARGVSPGGAPGADPSSDRAGSLPVSDSRAQGRSTPRPFDDTVDHAEEAEDFED